MSAEVLAIRTVIDRAGEPLTILEIVRDLQRTLIPDLETDDMQGFGHLGPMQAIDRMIVARGELMEEMGFALHQVARLLPVYFVRSVGKRTIRSHTRVTPVFVWSNA